MVNLLDNLQGYINKANERHLRYAKKAEQCDNIHQVMNLMLIITNAVATVLSTINASIPFYIVSIITGVATIISSVIAINRLQTFDC